MKITIITPVHNNEDAVEESLAAIAKVRHRGEIQHLLVDDGSTDRSPEIAQRFVDATPGALLIRKENGGEASALNRGLELAEGDFIATIEADVRPHPDWLEQLLPEFDDPEIMGAGGMLLTAHDDNWIARITGYEVESKFLTQGRHPTHITSAAAIYRREVFKQVGLYDEHLVNSSLDVDFNQRIIRAGGRLAYNPRAQAVHRYKSTIIGYLARQYAYARYRPFLKGQILYPRDRNIALQIALTGLLAASVPLAWSAPVVPIAVLVIVLGVQVPMFTAMWKRYRDRALIVLPLAMILRNLAGIAGLVHGYARKLFRR